jgi:hypothetical protein
MPESKKAKAAATAIERYARQNISESNKAFGEFMYHAELLRRATRPFTRKTHNPSLQNTNKSSTNSTKTPKKFHSHASKIAFKKAIHPPQKSHSSGCLNIRISVVSSVARILGHGPVL